MTHIFSVISYALSHHWHLSGHRAPGGLHLGTTSTRKLGRDATDDEVRLMFQSMLEDRFKFKAHHETRELPEFELTIAGVRASFENDAVNQ